MEPLGRYNNWTVLEFMGRNAQSRRLYRCRCDCGVEKIRPAYAIFHGYSRSCQKCSAPARLLGNDELSLRAAWKYMKQRCNPRERRVSKYIGALGITFDPSWQDFEEWKSTIPKRDNPQTIFDRLDYSGHFIPGNVCWSTTAIVSRKMHQHIDILCGNEQHRAKMEEYRHQLLVENWKRVTQYWRKHQKELLNLDVFTNDVGLPPRPYGQLVLIDRLEGFVRGNVKWSLRSQGARDGNGVD